MVGTALSPLVVSFNRLDNHLLLLTKTGILQVSPASYYGDSCEPLTAAIYKYLEIPVVISQKTPLERGLSVALPAVLIGLHYFRIIGFCLNKLEEVQKIPEDRWGGYSRKYYEFWDMVIASIQIVLIKASDRDTGTKATNGKSDFFIPSSTAADVN